MNSLQILGLGAANVGWLALVYAVIVFIIHVVLAFAANSDAKRLREAGGGLFLVGPLIWGWIV